MSDINPYASLPPERYWRRAVSLVPPFALDPSRPADFTISRDERVATAGSCFAQEVAKLLRAIGCRFHVTEPAGGTGEDGNFSARYGNIYTTRQLVQLFERAFGTFKPELDAWQRPDGRFVDPFRPRIEPAGFASPAEVAAAREGHLACVRELFRTLDTFVFTLGLTEGWRDARDGAALPLPPGVAGGVFDPDRYVFANARVAEMAADMTRFVDELATLNPAARVILTVSPVPLVATFEPRHVLVSNTSSKAALRVVAEELCLTHERVVYFPSFEIITAPGASARYFEDNLRTIAPAGIDHVMRCFLRHVEGGRSGGSAQASGDVRLEGRRASDVICDEELLDA